jgi:hypothetical protein
MDSLEAIEESLNQVLQTWYQTGYLRRWYELAPSALVDIGHEKELLAE